MLASSTSGLMIALLLGYMLADELLSAWTIGCSALIIVAVLIVVSE